MRRVANPFLKAAAFVECAQPGMYDPPMRRRLGRVAAWGSGVLFFFVCLLWVRSYWVMDSAGWGVAGPGEATNRDLYGVLSSWGRVVVVAMRDMPPGASVEPTGVFHTTGPPGWPVRVRKPPSLLNQMGFFLMWDHRERGFIVPHWFLALLLAVLPAYRIIRWRRSRTGRGESAPTHARP